MADAELEDTAQALAAKETEHAVPVGYWALVGGLVVWGIYYFFAYLGWDQAAELSGATTAVGSSIGRTIAFTAIPLTAVIVLAAAMARRGKGGK
jgi:TRAP-type C4-dicarboxylate transport system permease small subunit